MSMNEAPQSGASFRRRARRRVEGRLLGGPQFRRDEGLIPAASIAGRSLMTVVAIMTLLAAVAAVLALIVRDASTDWRAAVAQEMTVQIMPTPGRDIEADVASALKMVTGVSGILGASAVDKASSDALLEPWLGKLDLSELPVPRLVILRLDPKERIDVAALRAALRSTVPSAKLDDHRFWLERLAGFASALSVAAAGVFLLILVAIGTAVAFATRGAMAGAKEIIDVLHFVGAADDYIARQFQRHFFRLGAKGAAIGAAGAGGAFFVGGMFFHSRSESAGDAQSDLLFGSFSIGWRGVTAVFIVACAIAVLTALVSRLIVLRRLREGS